MSYTRTKIMATIASDADDLFVKKLVKNGVSIFRINSSHSNSKQIKDSINNIKKWTNNDPSIAIMQDLQGPKIRIGNLNKDNIFLKKGNLYEITSKSIIGDDKIVSTQYPDLIKDIKINDVILLDDGKITLKIISKKANSIICKILNSGFIKPYKGINLPNTKLSSPSLTKKDIEDLKTGLKTGIDWIALSFVRRAEDVLEIQKEIEKYKKQTLVISKIEKPEALLCIDDIIHNSDAIMVARGDLGVEIPMEKVPYVQKEIVKKCNKVGKPVIIATQMLETMIENPSPTRAEINDIANSVYDGADVLMLSGETAIGKYPIKAVSAMKKTILNVEKDLSIYNKFDNIFPKSNSIASDYLVLNTCKLSSDINAKAIIGYTNSGYTALKIAKYRPKSEIFIFTTNKSLLHALNLVWGIRTFLLDKKYLISDKLFFEMEEILKQKNLIKKNDICIHVGAIPPNKNERSNTLKISKIL